jgi:hypothetical protein
VNVRVVARAFRRFDERARGNHDLGVAHLGFFLRQAHRGDMWIAVGHRAKLREPGRDEDTLV